MPGPKLFDPLEELAKEAWKRRAEGLPFEFDLNRPISQSDINYIQELYAFIQILNPETLGETTNEIRFIRANSGWTIIDYDNKAICTSPGRKLFGSARYSRDENGTLVRMNSGTGTIKKQIVDTSTQIVSIVKERNWPQIHIVLGQEGMKWALWAAATEEGLEVTGFSPTRAEVEKYEGIKAEVESIMHPVPKKG